MHSVQYNSFSPVGLPMVVLPPSRPDWLDKPFFQRISPESKQLVATKTADIVLTQEQVDSLRARQFDGDPFFHAPDWIYIALQAFGEGKIDHFAIADLVLYDSCRRHHTFQYYTSRSSVSWDAILRTAFDRKHDKRLPAYHIDWTVAIETLKARLPEIDAHIYSYQHPCKDRIRSSDESGLYDDLLRSFMPIIPLEGDNEWKGSEEVEVLILPPKMLQELLKEQFGDQATIPEPVLGFQEVEETSCISRVMSIQHPEFAVIPNEIHGASGFHPCLQAVYFHDIYHLIVESANPYREVCVALASMDFPSLLRPTQLEHIRSMFADREIAAYLDPAINRASLEPLVSFANKILADVFQLSVLPELQKTEIKQKCLLAIKKVIAQQFPHLETLLPA